MANKSINNKRFGFYLKIFLTLVITFLFQDLFAQSLSGQDSNIVNVSEFPPTSPKNSGYRNKKFVEEVPENSIIANSGKPNKYSNKNYIANKDSKEDESKNTQSNWKCEELSIITKTKTAFNPSNQQIVKKCSDDEIICVFQPAGFGYQQSYSICFKRN